MAGFFGFAPRWARPLPGPGWRAAAWALAITLAQPVLPRLALAQAALAQTTLAQSALTQPAAVRAGGPESSAASAGLGTGCPQASLARLSLPVSATAAAKNQPVLIVALGSSSTRGWMASGIGRSYPAGLQRRLEDARPFAEFAVINRGIGGQTAADELARLDEDVVALKPQLVIWQAGANDALRGVGAERFRAVITDGVARLRAAGADVILMDNQRVPQLEAAPMAARLDRVLAEIAEDEGVNLFARSSLMQQWAEAGVSLARFTARDGLHLNDLGYACVADALARGIAEALPARTLRSYPPR